MNARFGAKSPNLIPANITLYGIYLEVVHVYKIVDGATGSNTHNLPAFVGIYVRISYCLSQKVPVTYIAVMKNMNGSPKGIEDDVTMAYTLMLVCCWVGPLYSLTGERNNCLELFREAKMVEGQRKDELDKSDSTMSCMAGYFATHF